MNAPTQHSKLRKSVTKEVALLSILLLVGVVAMPVIIYIVGQSVFGDYDGHGFGDFYSALSEKLRSGDSVALFLVLSPYLGWQCLRLMVFAWRLAGRKNSAA